MMRSPEALRKALRSSWTRNRSHWLAGGGTWPLPLPIGNPTKHEVMESWNAFDTWLVQWKDEQLTKNGHVQTDAKFKRSPFGEQIIPCSWIFDTPESVAAELGELARWERAKGRFALLMSWLKDVPADASSNKQAEQWRRVVSRRFDLLADTNEEVFASIIKVVDWIWKHPNSGLFPRQLPISGIDSKWVEKWRRLLTAWVWVLRGGSNSHNFFKVTGLRAAPDRLRMRLLDHELKDAMGGLSDIEAPAEEFIGLKLRARQVLIVENLVSGLACETLPGTVVFMRRGYAVEALAKLPWLAQLPVYYWGDIDTHGLAILSRLRGYLPRTHSLMMDEATLLAFKALWGREEKLAAPELAHLTEAEQQLYRALREGKYKQVRLEQERIAWDVAWQRATSAMSP
jgi:hypothetical protein